MSQLQSAIAFGIPFFLFLALVSLLTAIFYGVLARKAADPNLKEAPMQSHLAHIRGFLVCLGLAVLCIEGFVLLSGKRSPSSWLFSLHITIVATMTILVALTYFYWNGFRRPDIHRYFAWAIVWLFVLSLCTGIPILLERSDFVEKFREPATACPASK